MCSNDWGLGHFIRHNATLLHRFFFLALMGTVVFMSNFDRFQLKVLSRISLMDLQRDVRDFL